MEKIQVEAPELGFQTSMIDKSNPKNPYEDHFIRAGTEDTMEKFWAEQADLIDWYEKPKTILDTSNPPFYRWFKDGVLNTSYNCLDRHCVKNPNTKALIYESVMNKTTKEYTYGELRDYVAKFGGVLQNFGVQKGDRVIIYMPMIPEAIIAILACARVGATHSIVFGGFGGPELASRILDAKPKCIVLASCGIEPHKIVDYKFLCDEALQIAGVKIPKIIVQRDKMPCKFIKDEDFEFYTEMANAKPADPVPVSGSDYLYILYTSGTTGTPKGICRDNGGNAVALAYTMKYIFDIKPGEVYFSTSDIGWVVGHSYIIYGPLLVGATTLLFEGKPTGTPDAGIIWRTCEKYKCRGLYSSPTALRSMRREDPEGKHIKSAKLDNLNMISMAGERVDIPAYNWLLDSLPKHVIVNDNYWQTETGWSIGTNFANLHKFTGKPGSCTKPAPGMRVDIIGEDLKQNNPKQLGKVCIKLPMPPSFMPTLYGNDNAFIEKYLTAVPGYYFTGDAGYYDTDGYLHVTTRVDDIINTAGHRLSTSQMEEVLTNVNEVAEAAVVAGLDEIKGEIPVGFIVLKTGVSKADKDVIASCVQKIRHDIGPVAAFRDCIVVDKLPKTRSGKILRNVLKALVNGKEPKIPPTVEDETVVGKIKEKLLSLGLGHEVNIEYDEGYDHE